MDVELLVEEIRRSGVGDPAVLAAIARVPRHHFVPADAQDLAYANHPLSIGHGQTISQPYIVAFMSEAARLKPTSNVLEVGTGSGYQAAVLAELLRLGPDSGPTEEHGRLCSIEILPALATRAEQALSEAGYRGVELRVGDGYRGWPERAPFDAILVTAAPDHVPQPLIDQLSVGGRLIIPVGRDVQSLELIVRTEQGIDRSTVLPVRFVPMTGVADQR